MVIRMFDDLIDPTLPADWPDDPATAGERAAAGPWWAGLDATHNRFLVRCPGSEHRASLLEAPAGAEHAGHLVFRWHLVPTYGGGHVTCPRSLRPLCETPDETRPRPAEVRCPHEFEDVPA